MAKITINFPPPAAPVPHHRVRVGQIYQINDQFYLLARASDSSSPRGVYKVGLFSLNNGNIWAEHVTVPSLNVKDLGVHIIKKLAGGAPYDLVKHSMEIINEKV